MPRFGTFNVHASLLPQYRGAAPINWAVINGDTETGVTTFFLDHEIDTGRIIMQRKFDIPDNADVEYVYDGLMRLGAEVCLQTVDEIVSTDGHVDTFAQISDVDLRPAPKIFKETCRIDCTRTAKQIYDFIRGLSPYPGAWTPLVRNGEKLSTLKIFQTVKTGRQCVLPAGTLLAENGRLYLATADEWLEIAEIQMSGKKRMPVRDFLNGFKNIEECRLGEV